MRGLASGLLGLESMVLLLVIPVAVTIADIDPAVAIPAGVVLIVLCIVAIAGLGRGWGYPLGWVVQVLAIALGFVVPAMFVLGGIFALLWYSALRIAGKVEADKAAGGGPGSPGSAPQSEPGTESAS